MPLFWGVDSSATRTDGRCVATKRRLNIGRPRRRRILEKTHLATCAGHGREMLVNVCRALYVVRHTNELFSDFTSCGEPAALAGSHCCLYCPSSSPLTTKTHPCPRRHPYNPAFSVSLTLSHYGGRWSAPPPPLLPLSCRVRHNVPPTPRFEPHKSPSTTDTILHMVRSHTQQK